MSYLDTLNDVYLHDLYQESLLTVPQGNPGEIGIGMGIVLLSKVFGRAWIGKKILTPKAMAFLSDEAADFRDEAKLMNLIQMLGEGLYNLRSISGFDNVLDKLASDNIEAGLAEVESGRMLFHRGLRYQFVDRTGKKRNDYDIRILDDSLAVSCETKCKMEYTKYSSKSFTDALSQAKKQLPLGEPSTILMKIPENWASNEAELKLLSQIVVDKTKRPLGVVCWWENWVRVVRGVDMKGIRGFEIFNENGKTIQNPILPILPKGRSSNWTDFERFAKFVQNVK
jgi:hypothetical protein